VAFRQVVDFSDKLDSLEPSSSRINRSNPPDGTFEGARMAAIE